MNMRFVRMVGVAVALVILAATGAVAEEAAEEEGTIFTFWPLVDYRSSPKERFSNLSVLGPLFKYQRNGDDAALAVRPLMHRTYDAARETTKTNYLYPLVYSEDGPDVERVQALRGLFQVNTYRKSQIGDEEESSMLFPFYVKGKSPKYGPYHWIFPFYGDAYERFWKDEYHFVMFPLYGRTVKRGTTTRNYLYPFFSTIEGDGESGFQFWPLYGQSQKTGVYQKRFLAWPIFFYEKLGLNTDNPVTRIMALPLFSIADGPQMTSRRFLWPFFGYTEDRKSGITEVDWLWPFWITARGPDMEVNRFLPFYADERSAGKSKRWYLWPVYRHKRIETDTFEQDRHQILFFLFSDVDERWPKAGTSRRRSMLWPLFVYRRDERGVRSFSFPAPVEPVLDQEGIERNWAPLWRIYQQRWNEAGDSAVSFLWNLYWHEVRGNDLAYEFFPLISYQRRAAATDLNLFKGLIRYRTGATGTTLSFLWIPFGISWGDSAAESGNGSNGERIH